MPTSGGNNIAKIIEILAPYIFGSSGLIALLFAFITKRENSKIERANREIENFERLEKNNENYRLTVAAILTHCKNAKAMGTTFNAEDLPTMRDKLLYLSAIIDQIETDAEDVWHDGYYNNPRRKRN